MPCKCQIRIQTPLPTRMVTQTWFRPRLHLHKPRSTASLETQVWPLSFSHPPTIHTMGTYHPGGVLHHIPALVGDFKRIISSLPMGRRLPMGRLEKEMATHSSTLAWKIPWMEEPGRLQSMRLQRVGHDWATSLQGICQFGWTSITNVVK